MHIFQTVRHPEGFVRLIFDKDSQRSSRFQCTVFFSLHNCTFQLMWNSCSLDCVWRRLVHILCAHQRFRNRTTTCAVHTIVEMTVAHSFLLEGKGKRHSDFHLEWYFPEISASVPYIVWIYYSYRLMLLFIYLSYIKKVGFCLDDPFWRIFLVFLGWFPAQSDYIFPGMVKKGESFSSMLWGSLQYFVLGNRN